MDSKEIETFFKKRLIWGSSKKSLAYAKDLIEGAPDLLDRGLTKTCLGQMKELIEFCQQRGKGQDKELCWIYAMACCLYQQAFSRFGRKGEAKYLEKADQLAKENDFTDIVFWVNKCRLDYSSICGKSTDVQEAQAMVFSCLKKLKEPSAYEILVIPALAWDALNRGDFVSAQGQAVKLLESANELGYANLQVQGNLLLGKAAFELKRMEEALSYLEKAASLGAEKKVEQLIPALYHMAEVFLEQDKITEAKGYLEQAQQGLEAELELRDSYYHVRLTRLQGYLAQKEKQPERAEDYFNQSIKIAQAEGNLLEEGIAQLSLGQLYMEKEDSEKATSALEESSAKFIIIDNQFQLSRANQARQALSNKEQRTTSLDLPKEFLAPPKQKGILDDFMKLIISNLDLDAALNNVIGHIMKVTKADRGFLILLDEKGRLYSQVFRTKEKLDKKKDAFFKKFSQTIAERVLKTKKSILLTDTQSDTHFADAKSVLALDIRSVICVPLKMGGKETIGLIYIDRQSLVNAFAPEDLALVESLAEYASIALANARLHSGVQKKLKNTEAELIQAEKMATVGVLAGGVAHQINTPLGSILVNAEMLLREIEGKPEVEPYKEMLQTIEESTQRCKEIIELLLQYSRKTGVEHERLDLNQVIDKTYAFLGHQLLIKKISLIMQKGEVLPVDGNFNELMQVFTNLVVNAKESIRSVKKPGAVTIKSYQEGDFAVIEVKDDGVGIPKEHIKKIFDPFFTTKDIGKGTGLGLSIVYRIIENHKGSIEVSSEPQQGATFTIRIPVKKDEV